MKACQPVATAECHFQPINSQRGPQGSAEEPWLQTLICTHLLIQKRQTHSRHSRHRLQAQAGQPGSALAQWQTQRCHQISHLQVLMLFLEATHTDLQLHFDGPLYCVALGSNNSVQYMIQMVLAGHKLASEGLTAWLSCICKLLVILTTLL